MNSASTPLVYWLDLIFYMCCPLLCSLSLSIYISLSLPPSLFIRFSLSLYIYIYISLSLFLSLSFSSPSLPPSLSFSLSVLRVSSPQQMLKSKRPSPAPPGHVFDTQGTVGHSQDAFRTLQRRSWIANPFSPYSIQKCPEPRICSKFVPAIVFGGSSQGGLKFVKNLLKFEKRQFPPNFSKFWQISVPLTGTPKTIAGTNFGHIWGSGHFWMLQGEKGFAIQEVIRVRKLLSSGVRKFPKHLFYCASVQSERGEWSVTDLCWLLDFQVFVSKKT